MATKKQQTTPVGLLVIGAFLAGAAITAALFTVFASSPPPPAPRQSSATPPASAVPAVETPPIGATYDQLVQGGNLRMDNQNFQSAINYYTAALAIDSTDPNIWVDRGACRHAIGDGPGARRDFAHGLKLDPKHMVAQFNMGITYYTENRNDSAGYWFNRVVKEAPGTPNAQKAQEILDKIKSGQG